MEQWLLVPILLMSLLVMLLVAAVIKKQLSTRAQKEDISWVSGQLDRALNQIKSGNDEDVVLTGLQTIAVLNHPEMRLKALPIIYDLAKSENPRIAKQAQLTLEYCIRTLRGTGLKLSQASRYRTAAENGD